jgi:hypothetical protein
MRRFAFATVLVGAFMAGAGASAAHLKGAVHEPQLASSATEQAGAQDEPQTTGSIAKDSLPDNCYRARKRLWLGDDGWVVKRVTTCF